jgi:DNA-binding FrmR family transcriptional regulator
MRFPEEVNDDVLNRLRRLEGQIRGVQRMVEEGKDCSDIVTQLAACKAALDRVGYRLVVSGMRYCLASPDATAEDGVDSPDVDVEELERLFMKLS